MSYRQFLAWISVFPATLVFLGGGFVLAANMPERTEYPPVKVDPTLSLEQMIAVGRYSWVNRKVTPANFPVSAAKEPRAPYEVRLVLVAFEAEVDATTAAKRLDAAGLRPATLPELLAFGAVYTEAQKRYPIVALGSSWKTPNGHMAVPMLSGVEHVRMLDICGAGVLCFRENVRFAAVAK